MRPGVLWISISWLMKGRKRKDDLHLNLFSLGSVWAIYPHVYMLVYFPLAAA